MDDDTINKVEWKAIEAKVVKINELQPNSYNPNRMSGMNKNSSGKSFSSDGSMLSLLKSSILKYGFLFPVVVSWDENLQKYRIIDGYHRYEALKQLGVTEIAIVDLRIPYHDAIQLTVLLNRIKGHHVVEGMSDLVVKLEDLGLQDTEICENLGMETEEYMRLKQQLGIAHAFKNHVYSNSWESGESNV
jgi:ParB-like chromosome segregation protein Spo0J